MSIITFGGDTATELYTEGLWQFRVKPFREDTRNGPAIVLPEPVFMDLWEPRKRVLIDPVRDANPFFHVMEFIWMMAGRNDATWISQFNKNMQSYADQGIQNAAYGHRWRKEYGSDQIQMVVSRLKSDPTTRQAVISMWDPFLDNKPEVRDRACNTTIMFRGKGKRLNMLVCNRSNDFVWGALGANIVHMTMLHELIANFSGLSLGKYSVVSMNMHLYENTPNFQEIYRTQVSPDVYDEVDPQPIFYPQDDLQQFLDECEAFCMGDPTEKHFNTAWLNHTALPIYKSWMQRKWKDGDGVREADSIQSPDWRIACLQWIARRSGTLSSATLTAPSP